MARPVVLHVARDWVRPSEGFVVDLVRTTRLSRPVVACGRRWPGVAPPAGVRVHDLHRLSAGGDAGRPAARRAVRAALLAIAVGRRATVLHAHFGYWAAHAGRTASRARRPWLLSLHGHDLLVADRADPEAAVLRTADLVAVPSRWFADVVSRAGFADERIRVLPAGVDLAALPWRERTTHPGPVTVTFAGRFVEKKAPLDALAALVAADRELASTGGPRLRAVFAGTGPLEADLRAALARAVAGADPNEGLQAEIRDGAVPGVVRQALAETDVAVVASRTASDGDAETLGLVAVEAQAVGAPVVATRHGGLVEAVASDAGVLVPEGDPAALGAAIVDVVRRPGDWPAMGRTGRRHVSEHYDLAACTQRVEEAYLHLAATAHRRR